MDRGGAKDGASPPSTSRGVDAELSRLLLRRPGAALALLPRPAVLFLAGAVAGGIGKTLTAPLDRVKLLLQTRGGLQSGAIGAAAKSGKVIDALVAIGREEGFLGYWKGNLPQILKVIPYSATQLYSYELFKRRFQRKDGTLSVRARLLAGACAGTTATVMTYPLDTLRLRLAVDPRARSISSASSMLLREGSLQAFFRGLGASIVGIAPYMALELAIFDLIPRDMVPFARGMTSAFVATTLCYPLDTVRRHIQLSSGKHLGMGRVVRQIAERGGVANFYRGFVPNAVKNLPNKGIRLATFDAAKKLVAHSEDAYREELDKLSKRRRATEPL